MARPSIQQVRALGDFATQMNWNVQFQPPRLVQIDSYAFNVRCESTDVPRSTGTSSEIWIRGHRVKQPGVYTPSGTLTLTIVETVDNYISNLLRNWREMCWQTGSGVQQTTANVSGELIMTRLNRQDNPIWQYNVKGVYLEDYDPTGGNLQNQTADLIRPTLTLSYDWFEDTPLI